MVDLNSMLANYVPSWENEALRAEQEATRYRDFARWRVSSGDTVNSQADEAKALELDNEAAVWRLRAELARTEGVVLCDFSDSKWTIGEYKELVAAAATLKRLRNVEYDSKGRLQPVPYQPGSKPAGIGA